MALLAFSLYSGGYAFGQVPLQDQSSIPDFVENVNVANGTVAQPGASISKYDALGIGVLLNTLTNATVSFTSSPPRTYTGDGFIST